MPEPRDFLPQPPWKGPPIPRVLQRGSPRIKPRTKFEKQYTQRFKYKGREIWLFPNRSHIYAIPKEIRRGLGIQPSPEETTTYREIWGITKSAMGYISIDTFVTLSGYEPERVYHHMTWLVKNQQAIMNVDRMGKAVYVRLLGR